jgi:hypothetical protein
VPGHPTAKVVKTAAIMTNYGQMQPHLGATFYPGGSDDFYMPELVSPSPQRSANEQSTKVLGKILIKG